MVDGNYQFSAQIAYVSNAAGGSACTVTMTVSAAVQSRVMIIHEVSGIALTAPLDGNAGQINGTPSGGGCASTDCLTSGTFTTTANGDYIAAAMVNFNGNGTPITAGTGYALREGPENTNAEELTSEDLVQSTASSFTLATVSPCSACAYSVGTVVAVAFKRQ